MLKQCNLTGAQLTGLRHKLGLNQQDFWSAVNVTQSGGSRYESGRAMPRAVAALVQIIHVDKIDPAKLRKPRN